MPILSRAFAPGLLMLAAGSAAAAPPANSTAAVSRDATPATRAVLAEAARDLPPEDGQDFEFAQRGFIATWPDSVIRQANGQPSFNLAGNDFVEGPVPSTVNPALWRQNKVMRAEGLFRLAPGLYQVRNFDNSSVSFIETPRGWIVIDPLTVEEVARVAFDLLKQHVADKPILAVIYTHSHTDHFAGATGIIDPRDVAAGRIQVIAPKGFVEEVVSEWMMAGTAMGRRAFYQFGYFLPRDPKGHIGMGLGTAIAAGKQGFIPPTLEIERTGQSVTIDGVELVFQMTPGAEAPTEFNLWIPSLKALCLAETATSTLHNVQTLRGAKVRDAKAWADYLTEALRMWGGEAEISFASHHWPRFGNGVIRGYLANQRDAYKFIHDQAVRRMNQGQTPTEIAEGLKLPASLRKDWSVREFYGTVSHNAKAVYDRYMGWYDGVPANLNPHPPVEKARRMVKAMGGAKGLHKQAQAAFASGDYRWSAELANYGVFADPQDRTARTILADSYEQLGYQAESAIWRNIYLTGARELRQGRPDGFGRLGPSYLMAATPLDKFLDLLATTVVPERAGDQRLAFNLVDSISGDRFAITLGNAVLVNEENQALPGAPTLTAPKPVLLGILFGQAPLDAMLAAGQAKVEGDPAAIRQLLPMLEQPRLDFAIVEP
ncbi:MAG: MBL fold metallo-hydrolase [Sphingomonadaceae bacterium]|nr:MBL fold metallo-hydrolase [Sphingomonadaceae bacterium]